MKIIILKNINFLKIFMPNNDTAYCDRIEAKFPVSYSSAGITHFDCPRIGRDGNFVSCNAVESDGCPVYERLERMIAEGNGKG